MVWWRVVVGSTVGVVLLILSHRASGDSVYRLGMVYCMEIMGVVLGMPWGGTAVYLVGVGVVAVFKREWLVVVRGVGVSGIMYLCASCVCVLCVCVCVW